MNLEQRLIRPGEFHNELAHHLLVQSDRQFAYKYTETAQQIKGQKMVGIKWSLTKIN